MNRILFVEDNAPARHIIDVVMDDAKLAPFDIVSSAAEALEIIERKAGEYFLIVTDLHLLDLPGERLIELLSIMYPELKLGVLSAMPKELRATAIADKVEFICEKDYEQLVTDIEACLQTC